MQNNILSFFPAFLHVSLFDDGATDAASTASGLEEHLEKLRFARGADRRIRWLHESPQRTPEELQRSAKAPFTFLVRTPQGDNAELACPVYQPRLYSIAGSFDVAALFVAPQLEFSAWSTYGLDSAAVARAGAGTRTHLCLLPQIPVGEIADEDFNRDFLNRPPAAQPTDLSESFFCLAKLKLNPAIAWPVVAPTDPTGLDKERGHLARLVFEVARTIGEWRESTEVSGAAGIAQRPVVALGLGLGWAELVLVAFADTPTKFRSLLRKIRLLHRPLREPADPREPSAEAHLFLASMSTVGFHSRYLTEAKRLYEELDGERMTEPAGFVDALLERARTLDFGSSPLAETTPNSYFQLSCTVYPGHDADVGRILRELRRQLREKGLLPQGIVEKISPSPTALEATAFEAGRRDVWSAPIFFGGPLLTAQQAVIALAGLRLFLHKATWGADGRRSVLSVSEFFTYFGCLDTNQEPSDTKGAGWSHTTRLAHELFATKKELVEGSVKRLRQAMSVLQVPYGSSEQLLHLVSFFLWLREHEIIWDESSELLPVILALSATIEAQQQWWEEQAKAVGTGKRLAEEGGLPGARLFGPSAHREAVRAELRALHDLEIREFLRAFRAHFYNRHLASFATQELPDFNPRYRGSMHQLLSVANLIVSVLADFLLGQRATLAVIADTTAPMVDAPCGVLVVRLNLISLSVPLELEFIGHEIGHELLIDLQRRLAGRQEHPWRAFPTDRAQQAESVLEALRAVDETVFSGGLARSEYRFESSAIAFFLESTSDLLEYWLLAPGNGWEKALQSYCLRMALSSSPVSLPPYLHTRSDVPILEQELLMSYLVRLALATIAGYLSRTSREAESAAELRQDPEIRELLERLRRCLESQCVLGQSLEAAAVLRDAEGWASFLDREVWVQPWLADRHVIRLARAFFQELRSYALEPIQTTDPLLEEVREAFRQLRETFLPSWQRTLVVRHWMNAEERKKARDQQLFGLNPQAAALDDYFSVPWRCTPQPSAYADQLDRHRQAPNLQPSFPEPESVLYQRGQIQPRSDKVQVDWAKAVAAFYERLLPLIPSWRRRLLERANLRDLESRKA
jgi:hypothetical protein